MLKSRNQPLPRRGETRVYLVIADEAHRPEAMGLLGTLRETLDCVVDYSFVPAKVGKQFQAAEERGCAFAVVVDAQIKNGRVQVKNLTTREQIEADARDLEAAFRQFQPSA
jgi:histidyl-tRNA synthetase